MFAVLWWLIRVAIFAPLWWLTRLGARIRLGRRHVVRVSLGGVQPGGVMGDVVQTTQALRRLVHDDRVRGVLIDVRDVQAGQASLQALHDVLLELRSAGRTVLCHVHGMGWRELLVASAADRVWLTPSGEVFLLGLGAQMTFYGRILDTLGVEVDLLSVGRFKTFGEPYLRQSPSPASREQLTELLGDLQRQIVERIAAARHLDPDALLALLGQAPLSAEEALEAGLVDRVCYPDESSADANDLLGDGWRVVGGRALARWRGWERWLRHQLAAGPVFAVVRLEGPIVQGAGTGGGSGARIDSDRVVPVLAALADDDNVHGVVLAVSSPGGSALASDLIARSVQRLGTRKPVVAAFGDVSASGGYYLSAPASEIVAQPGTVTGSIGVVGGKVVVRSALARIGIHTESVAVGPDAGMLGPFAPFSASQKRRFEASLRRAYARFLGIVSAGRRRPVRAIEPHAAGRVWTGRQALERGLVDHLGGIDVALERVRLKAVSSRQSRRVVEVDFPPPRFQMLQSLLVGGARTVVEEVVDDVVLGRMGAGGLLVRYASRNPLEPLALLPVDITD